MSIRWTPSTTWTCAVCHKTVHGHENAGTYQDSLCFDCFHTRRMRYLIETGRFRHDTGFKN